MPNNMNPLMQQIQMLMQRGGNNPQAFAQQLLRQNPQFAREIQGQNPEQLVRQIMQQNGMDINQIMSMRGGKR